MGAPVYLLGCTRVTCKRNELLIVSDQTIQAEGLNDWLTVYEKLQRMLEQKYSTVLQDL